MLKLCKFHKMLIFLEIFFIVYYGKSVKFVLLLRFIENQDNLTDVWD